MDLQTPISNLPSVGPIYVRRLEKLEIRTVEDLLFHFPFRYEDFSLTSKISSLQEGEVITIQGKIVSVKNEFTRGRARFIQKAVVSDDTGMIEVIWFNQTYLTKTLLPGTPVNLSGKVGFFRKNISLVSPEYEIIQDSKYETTHTARLVPIYPETYGLSSKWLRNKIRFAIVNALDQVNEYLPRNIIEQNNLMPLTDSIKQIHFPDSIIKEQQARERLAFDEFLLLHVKNILRKNEWEQKRVALPLSIAQFRKDIERFWQSLPFTLTDAQKRAVKEIFADLAHDKPMNRLLEGDVGSGKTVVAAIGMYIAFLNGYQSILMAPTQILALQHYETISILLAPLGVNVGLITGSSKYHVSSNKNKKIHDTKYIIQNTDILIGTHALLSESVKLDKLAFIVIDEQHRFGVEQRGLLFRKSGLSQNPHVLTMTATPIPRTVALTLYGNLDLSYLDEMPKGRIPIKTRVVKQDKREAAYAWIKAKIEKEKTQAFIICPFIDESETLQSVKAATKEHEHLSKHVFSNLNVGLLHGRMKTKEKEDAMSKFRNGVYDLLVATPVVEVGIDIPNATIIVIEGSERFGLAQLHQLRGRVGRSNIQSFCLLFTDSPSANTIKRLKSLERLHVGAALAELDLKLRGPGELTGTRQHGVPKLKVASFSDFTLIEKTKKIAIEIIGDDPLLKKAPLLKVKLKEDTMRSIEPN